MSAKKSTERKRVPVPKRESGLAPLTGSALDGIYDNTTTKRREIWDNGTLKAAWHDFEIPYYKEPAWGTYPDVPHEKGEPL